MKYLQSILDIMIERTPQELIGALMLALICALVLAGLFTLTRKRVSDTSVLITVLMLAGNIVSMALAAGYIRYAWVGGRRQIEASSARHNAGPPPSFSERVMTHQIFEAADRDNDGLITATEAADAATRFVRQAAKNGNGRVDARELFEAVHRLNSRDRGYGDRIPPPWGFPAPAPPPSTIRRSAPDDDPALSRPKDQGDRPPLRGTQDKAGDTDVSAPDHSG